MKRHRGTGKRGRNFRVDAEFAERGPRERMRR